MNQISKKILKIKNKQKILINQKKKIYLKIYNKISLKFNLTYKMKIIKIVIKIFNNYKIYHIKNANKYNLIKRK